MFVVANEVPISDEAGNTIVIKSRMDFATQQAVIDDSVIDGKYKPGATRFALLAHNVVRWHGPAFDGVPCDAAHIRQLDPTEPLVEKVLDELDRRNAPHKETPDPKLSTSAGVRRSKGTDASR